MATQQGSLKIFFGYAAGVGKTYAMLKAAHKAKAEGIDVVVGYVERHTRPETLALLEGLEVIPCQKITYKNITLQEFDLDAALERKPEVVLVDELAHSNAVGCRHKKRYQDIQELLRAGIDVYTTVNVQHLESLNDLVESITRVTVSERVPDSIFDESSYVELVDIEPNELILRLREGKVYQKRQATRALNHFFTEDNLAALREIALRKMADRLSKRAKSTGNKTTSKVEEHILICLSESPANAKAIRTAARMAEAFHSGFTALFVETPGTKSMNDSDLKQLRDNLRLAEQLGAQITTVYGDDPAQQIAEYARVSGITKIVLGRNDDERRIPFLEVSIADRITKLAGGIEIYIIPVGPDAPEHHSLALKAPAFTFQWADFFKVILVVSLATCVGFAFYSAGLREANVIMAYILGVLLTAVWTEGHFYGVAASVMSVIAFNFFFTVPRYTLAANGPDYPVTFGVMLAASLISSTLATRVKNQAHQSAQKAYYMELLMNSSKKLQLEKSEQGIIETAAEQIGSVIDRPIIYALANDGKLGKYQVTPKKEQEFLLGGLTTEELAVADWAYKNNKSAGATTSTLSNANNLYICVRGAQEVMGIIAIPSRYYPELGVFEKNLMISILNECGLILERRRLRDEKQAIEIEKKQEQLRSNLLRGISHDLRTPLTSISGNAGVLMEDSITLDDTKRKAIYNDIYDDANWLINLTENLLSITRIENGKVNLNFTPELMEEVIHEALSHIDRKSCEHTITSHVSDDLLMARMDLRLIMQVIINITNNAIKYTPAGSHIDVSATKKNGKVVVTISDDGPGIPADAKVHLFDLFYTIGFDKADSRRGLGLGLSLCKMIVDAHGGTIHVTDNVPQGTVFTFTLPLEEVKLLNV